MNPYNDIIFTDGSQLYSIYYTVYGLSSSTHVCTDNFFAILRGLNTVLEVIQDICSKVPSIEYPRLQLRGIGVSFC